MKRYGFGWLGGCFLGLASLASTTSAQALMVPGPALFARYNYYSVNASGPFSGPSCFNEPSSMPAGRQSFCSVQPITRLAAGSYEIRVTNGAPLPSSEDSGYAVFVTTVGSNAQCSETSTSWSSNNLVSRVTCVTPSGSNVDANFSWFYRTDAREYPQAQAHALNFAYARVNRGNPAQTVGSQTFYPMVGVSGATAPTSQKLATGQYRVTFPKMNPADSFGHIESTTGVNNVIVQRTCSNDSSSTCKRAVCIPASWSAGSNANSNSTVDVHCYQGSTLVDVDFRVFMGNEAHSSQDPTWLAGQHYGWANAPFFGGNVCRETNEFKHRNQHESPMEYWPTLPLTACKTGTGAFTVPFAQHGFYHVDAASVVISSRTASGVYCNAGTITCGDANCLIPPDPAVTIRCYNSSGVLTNAWWNLSVAY
jgi:hypothetical protein